MKKVLIFGSFDILHPGHLFVIQEAKKYGEVHAVVALDETIQKVKWKPPVNSLEARIKNISQYGVIPHAGDAHDRLRVFREVNPDTVVLGYDQTVFVDKLKEYIVAERLPTKIITLNPFREDIFKTTKLKNLLEDPTASFIVTNKPSGEPSFRTVSALRRLTGIKQIGFAGTLDPIASGVLVVGIGAATKLLDWWHFLPKVYEVEARLGVTSDTYDREGTIIEQSSRKPSLQEIKEQSQKMTGTVYQIPPMYSAKKFKGKPLYKLAREGADIERKAVPVLIKSIEILEYRYPLLRLRVVCGSGTYIRSIIHDLGQALGTGGVMMELIRSAIGPYAVDQAVAVADLKKETYQKHYIAIEAFRKSVLEQGMFDNITRN